MTRRLIIVAITAIISIAGLGSYTPQSTADRDVRVAPTEEKSIVAIGEAERNKSVQSKPLQEKGTAQPKSNTEPTCNHYFVEDGYFTDWGEYQGKVCIYCGEGEYWLVGHGYDSNIDDHETEEATEETTQELTKEPEEPEEPYYDWETYEKPNKDSYGFNKGECDTPYAYNEEYFYNEGFDHWNVDVVYDADYANSKPPYNEHARQIKEQSEKETVNTESEETSNEEEI